jgi:hypothetical protein
MAAPSVEKRIRSGISRSTTAMRAVESEGYSVVAVIWRLANSRMILPSFVRLPNTSSVCIERQAAPPVSGRDRQERLRGHGG